jgi:membrane protein insertase Oxa1/YidC/SpoIIIJ
MQEKFVEEVNAIYKREGVNPFTTASIPLLQIPVFMGFYFAFSRICQAGMPSMVAESAALGFNLTQVDPLHLFNAGVGVTMGLHVRTKSISYTFALTKGASRYCSRAQGAN